MVTRCDSQAKENVKRRSSNIDIYIYNYIVRASPGCRRPLFKRSGGCVACAKAHKGGDANAKVVPCDPRIYTNNSNHSSSTKKKTQKHHKIRKTTSNRQQEA